jgi:predicted TIM-barrel fold metal-dependent hydrolase
MTLHTKQPLGTERLPVIDVDFHPMPRHWDPEVSKFLPQRWKDYIANYGLGAGGGIYTGSPPQREFTHRLDAIDKSGRVGTDPLFAKQQVLDEYDLTAAVLTCVSSFPPCGPNRPAEFGRALNRAFNDSIAETWLAADPRYYGSIAIPRDQPDVAGEIRRCKEGPFGDRFVQVLMSPAGAEPLGKERYWPIFEACVEYDLPIACHVPPMGPKGTAGGATTYYCELHMNLAAYPMTIIPSMIFEGVFDRFPTLKVALIELGWSFAATLAWRLDAVHDRLRRELSHLKRRPSDYMREHFWYATQPIEEPERPEHLDSVYRIFEENGFANQLMYSSDYPHWDFDAPTALMSAYHPVERRRRILGENASKLYKIPLKSNSGIVANPHALAAE